MASKAYRKLAAVVGGMAISGMALLGARSYAETAIAMTLTSTAFAAGEVIPRKHTGEGEDVSPPLKGSHPAPLAS